MDVIPKSSHNLRPMSSFRARFSVLQDIFFEFLKNFYSTSDTKITYLKTHFCALSGADDLGRSRHLTCLFEISMPANQFHIQAEIIHGSAFLPQSYRYGIFRYILCSFSNDIDLSRNETGMEK